MEGHRVNGKATAAGKLAAAAIVLALGVAIFAPGAADASEAAYARQETAPPEEPEGDATPQTPQDEQPTVTPKTITVGEFLVQVATALKLQAPHGGFAPDSASFALRGKGAQIETPAASLLTEADAVKVLDALGYRVVTKTPSRTVNDQQAKLLIATFLTSTPS